MWGLTYVSLVAKTNQDIFSISHISGSISPPWPVWFMFYQLSIKFITRLRVTTSRPSPRVGWSWGQPPCRPRGCTPASSPAETSPSLRTATPRRSWSPVSSLIWQTVSPKDWYIMIHQYFFTMKYFSCLSSSLVSPNHLRRPDRLLPGRFCQSQLLHI